MRLYLFKKFGEPKKIELQERLQMVVPFSGAYLQVCLEDNEVIERLEINNQAVVDFFEIQNAIEIPGFSPRKSLYSLRFSLKDGSTRFYELCYNPNFRPEQKLLIALADFHHHLQELTSDGRFIYKTLHDAIRQGKLLILARQDAKTGLDKEWLLNMIEASLRFLIAVCNKPYQHLRIEEAIRPVDVVRRTGPAALQHIASHSEHWEARTVSGLRPARILAQTVADDLELYENRFVKTLIDRLLKYIKRSRFEVKQILDQIEDRVDWNSVIGELSWRQFEMFEMLIPSFDPEKAHNDQRYFSELFKRLLNVQRILTGCRSTYFYQSLINCTPVYSPINPTNILTMDPNYQPLFDLWQELDRTHIDIEEGIDGGFPQNYEIAYDSYCQVVILAALDFAGFEPIEGEQQIIGELDEKGGFSLCGSFKRDNWVITPQIVVHEHSLSMIKLQFTRKFRTSFEIPEQVSPPDTFSEELTELVKIVGNNLIFYEKPLNKQLELLRDLLRTPLNLLQSELDRLDKEKKEKRRFKQNENKDNKLKKLKTLKQQDDKWREFIEQIRDKIPEVEQFYIYVVPIFSELGKYDSEIVDNTTTLLHDGIFVTTQYNAKSAIIVVPSSPRMIAVNPKIPYTFIRRLINYGDTFTEQDAKIWGHRRVGMLPISPMFLNSLQRFVRLIRIHTIGSDIASGKTLEFCPICENIIRSTSVGFTCQACGAQWNQTTCRFCGHQYGFLRPTKSKSQLPTKPENYGVWIERLENMTAGLTIGGFCEAFNVNPFSSPICPNCGKCSEYKTGHTRCYRCQSQQQ